MKKVTINLYSLNELNKKAKEKAISEHREFLASVFNPNDYDPYCKMTLKKYTKELTKSDVVEDIEINDYIYFYNGNLASIVNYTDRHPKSGTTILTLEGEEYNLK